MVIDLKSVICCQQKIQKKYIPKIHKTAHFWKLLKNYIVITILLKFNHYLYILITKT